MNKQTDRVDLEQLESDISRIVPLIRQCRLQGPSDPVLRAIHDRAVAQVSAQVRYRRRMPIFRALAAAATLALLLGGAIQTRLSRQAGAHAQAVRHLLQIGAPQLSAGPATGAAEIANRLLTIQGLDDEALFTSEETEVLWL